MNPPWNEHRRSSITMRVAAWNRLDIIRESRSLSMGRAVEYLLRSMETPELIERLDRVIAEDIAANAAWNAGDTSE